MKIQILKDKKENIYLIENNMNIKSKKEITLLSFIFILNIIQNYLPIE